MVARLNVYQDIASLQGYVPSPTTKENRLQTWIRSQAHLPHSLSRWQYISSLSHSNRFRVDSTSCSKVSIFKKKEEHIYTSAKQLFFYICVHTCCVHSAKIVSLFKYTPTLNSPHQPVTCPFTNIKIKRKILQNNFSWNKTTVPQSTSYESYLFI